MKRNLLRIITFAALVVGVLAGCQDDIGKAAVEGGVGREGRRLKSEISVVPMQNDTPTKSLYGGDESVVNNWALLQFDGVTEKLVAMYYQESGANIGNIKVVAGHPYYWFAVANLGDVRSQFSIGTTTTAGMASWYATGIDMSTASGLPMSWASSGTVAFTKEQISGGATLDVDMTRMVAKYNVVLDKSGLSVFTFSGATGHQGASIMGPGSVKAFAESNATDVAATVSSTDGFSSMDIARFYGGNQAVVLYAAENMYGDIESIDTPAKKKASNVGTRKPTYVQVYGQASGDGYENVPLTYRFYLGQNATSNFDVIRNTVSTVTLKLTDDAIRSAIAVANNDPDDPYYPDDPDIWKIESQPVSDTRVLMFSDGVQNGGTGSLSLTLGERTAEALVRTPADLAYQFKMDAALYSAGFRAYADAAGTTEVDSGYGSDYVTVTGAPGTLYFYAPTGISPTTGKVYVKTTDGRKSDELTLTAGRVLDHLEVEFGTVPNINGNVNATGEIKTWNSLYGSDPAHRYNTRASEMDTIIIQNMNNATYANGFAMRVYAVYTDGSRVALNNDRATDPAWQWETKEMGNTIDAMRGLWTNANYFFHQLTSSSTSDIRIRTAFSGWSDVRIYYTEGDVTADFFFKTTVHVGNVFANPESTSSNRIEVPMTGSVDVRYVWRDNNNTEVDITSMVAADNKISVSAGGTYLKYDGLVGGAARFSGKGVAGNAQSTVSGTGYVTHTGVVSLYGENPQKVRAGSVPTANGISSGNFDKFRYSYFSVVDTRVLDHITIVPSRIYAPGVSTSSDETVNYKVYAYFEGDATPVDITTSSDLTVTPMTYYNSSFPYPQWYLEDPSSSMGWRFVTMRDIPTVSGEYLQAKYRKTSHNNTITNRTAITTNTDANTPYFTVSYTFGGKTCTDSVKPSLEDTRTVVALNVTPNPVSLYEGQSQQFTATAVYDTGDEVNVTTMATWSNDANGKLTNNGGGSYTGVTPGTTTVTATYGGVNGTANVTVSERTVSSFVLQMKNPSTGAWETSAQTVNLGSDQQWRLMVTYADSATPEAVTSGFNLTTSDSGVISVSGTGSHAEAVGTSNIGATYKGKTSTNTVKVTVQSHEYSYELLVTDRSFSNSAEGYAAAVSNNNSTTDLDWDETQGFYAYYVRKDHGIFDQMTDVSSDASWTIDSDLTASNVGSWNGGSQIYTANNTSGSVVNGNLEAEYSGEGGVLYADKTISVAYYIEPQYRLVVTLDDSTIDIDETTQATATLYTSTDGGSTWDSGTDVTSSADFSSSAPGKATVASGGTVTGVDTGTAVISATYNGISSSDDPTVTVSGYRIGTIYNRFIRLEVRPNPANIEYSDNEDFELWCVYEHARRTGGDTFDSWAEDEFEITNATWSQSPGNYSSIVASTGVLTNTNKSGSTQEVTVTANAGESRIWWTAATYGDTPSNNLTASASAKLTSQGHEITYGGFYITIDDDSIAATGKTYAHAYVKKYDNGSFVEDVNVTSDSDFTITDGGSYASISGNTITGKNTTTDDKTVTVQGTYDGGLTVSGGTSDTETLTVEGKVVGGLSASPDELTWEWDESGSGDGKSVTVTVSNCEISSVSTSSGFSYSRSGNTITVWPDAQNTSTTTDKTGTLTISGTNGASDITVDLTQTKKPAPTLVSLSFDQSHYDLVSVSGGEISLEHSYTLTANYSDGSSVDVTSLASYSDQGSVTVNKVSGTLTATSSCSNKVLTGTYQGMSTTATYSAEDLDYVYDFSWRHCEGTSDLKREFLIEEVRCTYKNVFTGETTIVDVSGSSNVNVSTSSQIVFEGYETGVGYMFHFTANNTTGTVTFTYTENGISKSTTVNLRCDSTGHVEDY